MSCPIKAIGHGETLTLQLNYTVNGVDLAPGIVDEIELYFGGVRYTLSGGEIVWDQIGGVYQADLDQEATFALPNIAEYQLRVKKDDMVGNSEIGYVKVKKTISEEVL